MLARLGADLAPLLGVQSKDYDLEGEYIRKWIPELANVPQSYIHEPWKMPPDVAAQVRCCIISSVMFLH